VLRVSLLPAVAAFCPCCLPGHLQKAGTYTETCDIDWSNIVRVMVEHVANDGRDAPMLYVSRAGSG
jgi:hypothetical protein